MINPLVKVLPDLIHLQHHACSVQVHQGIEAQSIPFLDDNVIVLVCNVDAKDLRFLCRPIMPYLTSFTSSTTLVRFRFTSGLKPTFIKKSPEYTFSGLSQDLAPGYRLISFT